VLFRDRQAALANTTVLIWTSAGWIASFALMGASSGLLNVAGVVLCAHAMVLAAYLVHEAAHQTLFARAAANQTVGEVMSFIAGSSYASFERIRHMHIRHHVDRADLACFDFRELTQSRPVVRKALELLEWAYVPATEILMHLQVIWRPFWVRSQRPHLPRAAGMLAARIALLAVLGFWSLKALVLYGLAAFLLLHVLNLFDAFHHTFEQYFVEPDQPVPMDGRNREYEFANTYSNLVSTRYPWINLLTLNFCYHNAHHHRPSAPWYRLPALHGEIYGGQDPCVLPLRELLRTWHRNRVRRVRVEQYGSLGNGAGRADGFIGTHAVSFLTVV
jgi:fatty acid desaturase